jgi:hypothetical protein
VGAPTPSISSLSPNPNPPVAGQQVSLTINGSNFDPSTVEILITGTACSPCTVPNGVLTTKTSSQVIGPVTLNNSGSFSVSVKNVGSGLQSGTLSLTVNAPTPSISSLSPNPNPPRAGQQFSLTINGSNFDPATVEILITGTNCGPCTVPNGVLTTKTSSQVIGPVTLNNSTTFSVAVKNVGSGLQSGTLNLTVQ